MPDEKVFKEVYDDMRKKGHCNKTSYDKYRQKLNARDMDRKKREFESRRIIMK